MGVPDRNGKNDYDRPVVILTPDDEISAAKELFGMVCSTTSAMRNPRPHYYIELPHQPQGKVRTKLTKPTVAICTWTVPINPPRDIKKIGGVVPPDVMELMIDKARECRENGITDT
jgi:hypothetical protein